MSNDEKLEQVRNLIVNQLQSILELSKDDIKGSDLELKLKLALQSLQQKTNEIEKENNFVAPNDNYDDYEEEAFRELGLDYGYDEDENYNDEDLEEPVVPDGFDDEGEYQDFLTAQSEFIPEVVNPLTDEEEKVRPDDVAGVRIDEDSNIITMGNMEDSLNKIHELMVEDNTIRDEETDEVLVQNDIDEVNTIQVSMTRENGQELTTENVRDIILAHPVSRPMLDTFGHNYTIQSKINEPNNKKFIIFVIDNNNPLSKMASQGLIHSNYMTFGGKNVFPGLGMIKAQVEIPEAQNRFLLD